MTTAYIPEKKAFPITPAGTHVARIYGFMNMGTRQQQYQGVDKPYKDTLVRFTLELPNKLNKFTVTKDDGTEEEVSKPFVISREFTLSMGKKSNLRPFVEGVIGTTLTDKEAGAFEMEDLLGRECLATVTHVKSKTDPDKVYANLTNVTSLVEGMECPAQINPNKIEDVNEMSLDEINALPSFLQEKMRVSDEFIARFDENEIARRKQIQEEIDARKPQGMSAEEITDGGVPF